MKRLTISLISFVGALLALSLPARGYQLPPEKLLQYWAGRVGHYGTYEIRGQHALHLGQDAGTPDVAAVRILYSRDGVFRLDREGKKEERYTVIGNSSEVLAIRNGIILGPEVSARYDFAKLFGIGSSVKPEALASLRQQGVMMDSPPVLWLLWELSRFKIDWHKTRLAPYTGDTIVYVMGRSVSEPAVVGRDDKVDANEVRFDNREFTPLEFRRIRKFGNETIAYRTVMSEYDNGILKYYPRRIVNFVDGQLAEEFTLESVKLRPKFQKDDLDLSAVKEKLLPKPVSDDKLRPKKRVPKDPSTMGTKSKKKS